jgi:hypothetical protein
MNPADRCRDCLGKGKVKEGVPPPARRSARTNPSAEVGDFVDPCLLKPPPGSIPHAPVAGMPLLVRVGDVPPARAAPPYPLRNTRTPAPNPPSVIYRKVGAQCDISLLKFQSPTLPPIYDGIPDVFIEGQELDFRQQGVCARGGDDLVDDDVSSNDDENTKKDNAFDDNDDDEDSNYYANGKDDDPNGLDYSSSDDDDNNLRFDADLEEFELVDFSDPNRGKKTLVDRRRYKDGPSPPDY